MNGARYPFWVCLLAAIIFLFACETARASGQHSIAPNVTQTTCLGYAPYGGGAGCVDLATWCAARKAAVGAAYMVINPPGWNGGCILTNNAPYNTPGAQLVEAVELGPPQNRPVTVLVCPTNPHVHDDDPSQEGATCGCDAGWKPASGAEPKTCVDTCAPQAGQTTSLGLWGGTGEQLVNSMPPINGCIEGCQGVYNGLTPEGYNLVDGKKVYWAKGQYIMSGHHCNAQDPTQPPDQPASAASAIPPSTCQAGSVLGSVNGKPVCGDPATGKADVKSNTIETVSPATSAPNGGTQVVKTTVVTNPDGTKQTTTTTTVTAPNGTVTTTTQVEGARDTLTYSSGKDGLGNGGAQGGSGSGDGEGGGCKDNPSKSGCGGPGGGHGDGYTEKSRTFSQVLADRKSEFQSSGLGQASAGFFTVSSAGSCPTWTMTIPFFNNASYTLDFFCLSWVATALQLMGYAVLCVCAFLGFKVAFL